MAENGKPKATIFHLRYKNFSGYNESHHFVAESFEDAQSSAQEFCRLTGQRFIQIQPFIFPLKDKIKELLETRGQPKTPEPVKPA
jgi:hypothetical protein